MANIVPGVVALVMAVVGAFLTSLTIAREWERGTMEQLISTPVGKLEIQIGKLAPYFVIGMMDTAVCAGVAVWWFGVPFRGSWTVLFGCSMLFLIVVLSLGYLHFGDGQVPTRRQPNGPAGDVPADLSAVGFHLSHRADAGRRAVDHASPAGALLRLHSAQRLPEGHGDSVDGGTAHRFGDHCRWCSITLATRAFHKRLE